jgi:WD40 repeat protein
MNYFHWNKLQATSFLSSAFVFFLIFFPFFVSSSSFAIEPQTDPIFRIESGMHVNAIRQIATDRDGRWLVTVSNDKTARVWNIAEDRLQTILRVPSSTNHEGMLNAVAMSPSGETIAVGGAAFNDGQSGNSIYIFDRASGKLLRRLIGLPQVIFGLAFTQDGNYLATTLANNGGLFIYSVSNGRLLGIDRAYKGDSYSVDFKNGGRLVTTSTDGFLRLYQFDPSQEDGRRLSLLNQITAPGGRVPMGARFSPDGSRIAVGFADTTAVNILKSIDLSFDFAPDTSNVISYKEGSNLSEVEWSQDGTILFAAGGVQEPPNGPDQSYIRRWSNAGKGAAKNLRSANNRIFSIAALPNGSLAFGSADPSWGIINTDGIRKVFHPSTAPDLRDNWEGFALSPDGAKVRFSYEVFGNSPVVFGVQSRQFHAADDRSDLIGSTLSTPKINVEDWKNSFSPKLNGKQFKFSQDNKQEEMSTSLALLPSGKGFVLGTDRSLRYYDSEGKFVWGKVISSAAVALNFSQDGRWLVAAYLDGTIRWHRPNDGSEQLAFFPHADKKRWVMWTPEGYYDASIGGEELIGWHLNQGKEKEPNFITNGQLYDVFYRPDIVQAKFRGDDISKLISISATEALKNPPPTLVFTKIPPNTKNITEQVCYKVISSGGGIGEVRLFHNGKLIKSDGFYRENIGKDSSIKIKLASMDSASIQRELRDMVGAKNSLSSIASTAKKNDYEECQEIHVTPGENEISVSAFNESNTVQSRLESTQFSADLKQPEPHLYVLSVGINRYNDSSVNLEFAVKDSNDFVSAIKSNLGVNFKSQNIHLFGLADGAANKEGVQKAIQELSKKVKPWDTFILFVASHGVLIDNQYFIVTSEYNGSFNATNLISSNEIVGMSTKIKSLTQLFIFDTCYAGGIDNIIRGLYDARMAVMAKKMGLHIFASAGSTQTALDGYKGNGLFTHTLLKSVRDFKNTDLNRDDQISVFELGQRAKKETMSISKELGRPQSPNIINFGRDSILFISK